MTGPGSEVSSHRRRPEKPSTSSLGYGIDRGPPSTAAWRWRLAPTMALARPGISAARRPRPVRPAQRARQRRARTERTTVSIRSTPTPLAAGRLHSPFRPWAACCAARRRRSATRSASRPRLHCCGCFFCEHACGARSTPAGQHHNRGAQTRSNAGGRNVQQLLKAKIETRVLHGDN